MPRRLRFASGGFVYHVLNQIVARARIFDKSMDYAAFERVLKQADAFVPMRLLAYCILSNHWHLVLCGRKRGRESFCLTAPAAWRSFAACRDVCALLPAALSTMCSTAPWHGRGSLTSRWTMRPSNGS